ncbi:hypothetical protein JCM11491_004059 [Sporobolomyces phaffii]
MPARRERWLENDPHAQKAFEELSHRILAREQAHDLAGSGSNSTLQTSGDASRSQFRPISRRGPGRSRDELDELLERAISAFKWKRTGVSPRESEAADWVADFKRANRLYSEWDALPAYVRDRVLVLFERTITQRDVEEKARRGFGSPIKARRLLLHQPKEEVLANLVAEFDHGQQQLASSFRV